MKELPEPYKTVVDDLLMQKRELEININVLNDAISMIQAMADRHKRKRNQNGKLQEKKVRNGKAGKGEEGKAEKAGSAGAS